MIQAAAVPQLAYEQQNSATPDLCRNMLSLLTSSLVHMLQTNIAAAYCIR